MSASSLQSAFEAALQIKLGAIASAFPGKLLQRLDVGVFPWHGSLELSLLFVDDECSETDIAAWPYYDVSCFGEGKWPEALVCCREMRRLWEENPDSSKTFFQSVAEAMKSQQVQLAIDRFDKADGFTVTLFGSDNKRSENYAA